MADTLKLARVAGRMCLRVRVSVCVLPFRCLRFSLVLFLGSNGLTQRVNHQIPLLSISAVVGRYKRIHVSALSVGPQLKNNSPAPEKLAINRERDHSRESARDRKSERENILAPLTK